MVFLGNSDKETAYFVGTIYCFIMILHKLTTMTFYYLYFKTMIFEDSNYNFY